MSAQHTPGPWGRIADSNWTVDTGGSHTLVHVGPIGEDPVAIVVIPRCWSQGELLEANARLIAAAPEMVAMLREVAEGFALHNDILDLLAKIDGEG